MPSDPQTEQFRMSLPVDLLSALDRQPVGPRNELRIDGLTKPSIFARLVERLIARRRR